MVFIESPTRRPWICASTSTVRRERRAFAGRSPSVFIESVVFVGVFIESVVFLGVFIESARPRAPERVLRGARRAEGESGALRAHRREDARARGVTGGSCVLDPSSLGSVFQLWNPGALWVSLGRIRIGFVRNDVCTRRVRRWNCHLPIAYVSNCVLH